MQVIKIHEAGVNKTESVFLFSMWFKNQAVCKILLFRIQVFKSFVFVRAVAAGHSTPCMS